MAKGSVATLTQGVDPGFNSAAGGLPLGHVTLTDMSTLAFEIEGLEQGVTYFARVAATNGKPPSRSSEIVPLRRYRRCKLPSDFSLKKGLTKQT